MICAIKGAKLAEVEFSEENTYIRFMAVKMTSKFLIFFLFIYFHFLKILNISTYFETYTLYISFSWKERGSKYNIMKVSTDTIEKSNHIYHVLHYR